MGLIRLPSKWKDWEIVDVIGSGSYGTVYEAVYQGTDPEMPKSCAIKRIRIPGDDTDEETLRREYPDDESIKKYYDDLANEVMREVSTMEDLKGNPNVVAMLDHSVEERTDTIGWDIYIMMELLESFEDYTLSTILGEKDVLRLGIDICTVLEACAQKRIIHRDIKPDNIMVSPEGTYKLGDFGIARHIQQTLGEYSLKGTYTYMAPEVYHGLKYQNSVDMYSLGIVLYRLMNHNREPFVDPGKKIIYFKDREEALQKRMDGEIFPDPVDASEGLAEVLKKACAFWPKNRYAGITEFKTCLQQLLDGNYQLTGFKDSGVGDEKDKIEELKREAQEQEARHKEEMRQAAKELTKVKHSRFRTRWAVLIVAVLAIAASAVAYFYYLKKDEISSDYTQKISEAQAAIEAFDKNLWTCLAENTYDQLNFPMTEEEFDREKDTYYNADCDESSMTRMIAADGETFCGEVIRYHYSEEENLNGSGYSRCRRYYVRCLEDGSWTLADSTDAIKDRLVERISQEIGDKGYEDAVKDGRNAQAVGRYSWLDETYYLPNVVGADIAARYQEKDGSVKVIVSVRNGTEEAVLIHQFNLCLTDPKLGEIAYTTYIPDEDAVFEKESNTLYTITIAPGYIRTGNDEWTDEDQEAWTDGALQDTVYYSIDKISSLLPEEYFAARESEHNAVMFGRWQSLLRAHYQSLDASEEIKAEVKACWQNEDGSMGLYLSIQNGTRQEGMASGLNIKISDEKLGIIYEGYMDLNKHRLPAYRNTLLNMTIPAEDVVTGKEKWSVENMQADVELILASSY